MSPVTRLRESAGDDPLTPAVWPPRLLLSRASQEGPTFPVPA